MEIAILIGSFTIVCLLGMPVKYGAQHGALIQRIQDVK